MPGFRSNYLLTSAQLVRDLPLVLFLIVEEMAFPIFAGSTRAAPARNVLIRVLELPQYPNSTTMRTKFDGSQWNAVAVPLLEDIRTWGWRGKPQPAYDDLTLGSDVYGPGEYAFRAGQSLGTRNHSTRSIGTTYPDIDEYLVALGGLVQLQATEAGY